MDWKYPELYPMLYFIYIIYSITQYFVLCQMIQH